MQHHLVGQQNGLARLEVTADADLEDSSEMSHAELLTRAEVSNVTGSLQLLQTQDAAAFGHERMLCLDHCCFALAAHHCYLRQHAVHAAPADCVCLC